MEKDGDWAWIISVGVFVGMFLETGMVKSLGVLLPELREQFSAYTWVIGLAISLIPGFGVVTCELLCKSFKTFVTLTLFCETNKQCISETSAAKIHLIIAKFAELEDIDIMIINNPNTHLVQFYLKVASYFSPEAKISM